MGLLVFYISGVLIIMMTMIPHLLGDEFNDSLLTLTVLFLWPMLGKGNVKSIVNVFRAKQYHPLLQSSLMQSYYVLFYTVIINIFWFDPHFGTEQCHHCVHGSDGLAYNWRYKSRSGKAEIRAITTLQTTRNSLLWRRRRKEALCGRPQNNYAV
jgi:hypothetical protein